MYASMEPGSFTKQYEIGSVYGNRGSVWSVTSMTSNTKLLAMKIYQLDDFDEELKNIQNEVQTVRQLNHENIIPYLSVTSCDDQVWILMPLYGFTSISRVVSTHFTDGLPEKALCLIIKDVLKALNYLHHRGIIHRAVEGAHILLGVDGVCVLSGFRHSISAITEGSWEKSLHDYPSEIDAHLNWASPEILRQDLQGYDRKTDIYSLGITLCELGNGEVPYCRLEPQLILVEKSYGRLPYLRDANTCKLIESGKDSGMGESYGDCLALLPRVAEKSFSASCHDFVSQCLKLQSEDRPSALQLLSHNFIRQSKKISETLPELLHPVVPLNNDAVHDGVGASLLISPKPKNDASGESFWDFETN